MDEEQLLEALRRGDEAAFTALFEAHSDRVYRVAVGLLRDEVEADCVVQETFLSLFEHLGQFEGRSRLGTWLYRVSYNRAIDRLRRRQPQLPLTSVDGWQDEGLLPANLSTWQPGPEARLTAAELQAELDRAIATLPEKYRIVFILRELEGLSTAETAEVTGVSLGAVKVALHRARLMLRERLADLFGEQGEGHR